MVALLAGLEERAVARTAAFDIRVGVEQEPQARAVPLLAGSAQRG